MGEGGGGLRRNEAAVAAGEGGIGCGAAGMVLMFCVMCCVVKSGGRPAPVMEKMGGRGSVL